MKKGGKKSMRTVREILTLHFEHGLSPRAIARSRAASLTKVGGHIERAVKSGRDSAALSALDDSSLKIFCILTVVRRLCVYGGHRMTINIEPPNLSGFVQKIGAKFGIVYNRKKVNSTATTAPFEYFI